MQRTCCLLRSQRLRMQRPSKRQQRLAVGREQGTLMLLLCSHRRCETGDPPGVNASVCVLAPKLAWSQGFILDGWPATVSEAVALERGLTGLDLQREEAVHARSPRLAPPPRGWLPDPLRALTSGGHSVACLVCSA